MVLIALLLVAMMVMIVIADYSKFHWVFIAPSYGFIAPIVVTTLSTFSGSPAILFYPMKVCLCVSQFVNCFKTKCVRRWHFHR